MNNELTLSRDEKEQLLDLLQEKENRIKYNYINTLFVDDDKAITLPDCTKSLGRGNYPKHMEFFSAGADFTERAFIAGNQCMALNSQVLMADGTQKNIQDIKIGEQVSVYDIKTDTLIPGYVTNTFKGRAKNNIKVGIGKYQSIVCTDDHPFLYKSNRDKVSLKEIKTILNKKFNRKVVLPTKWEPEIKVPKYTKETARLLGYLIGDGCLTGEYVQFTNTDSLYVQDVRQIAELDFGLNTKNFNTTDYRLTKLNGLKGENELINLLRELGLWGKYSGEKFIPPSILTAPKEYILEFLKGLIATDGSVSGNRFTYYTIAKKLALDLKILLLRLGIYSTHYIDDDNNPNHAPCYVVGVSYAEGLLRLPSIGRKQVTIKKNKTTRTINTDYLSRTVKFISEEPEQDIYCITVNHPDHIFVCNGFLTKNTGKTTEGLCELYWHCSGLYPKWWDGKRFNKPITAWLCGDRGEIIRDGMQQDLTGRTEMGTGIIPKDMFHRNANHENGTSSMPGVPGGIGQYFIKHVSGGVSKIVVKTYNAGKNAFESAKVDCIMLDEECPMDIYVECQIRTITTGGIVYLTFTPDSGLTDTVLHFLDKPKEGEPAKFVAMVGWDDVPHLSEKRKKQLLATIPIHLRDVKTKGKPYLGMGAIYPIPEEEFVVRPFKIPEYWPKAFAFDPGWRRTAALWGAYDAESDIWYLYSEYYRGQAEPAIHCSAIRGRGEWIQGVADPHGTRAGKGVASKSFLEAYENLGLDLTLASPSGAGSVEIGINEVYQRLSSGRLKVFSTMQDWLYEYRIYRRKENGQIVETNNHLMDCTRYLCLCGAQVMSVYRDEDSWGKQGYNNYNVGRSEITGY